MGQARCDRCRDHVTSYIPTHQYVKFDDKVYTLCDVCWELFRAWFFGAVKSGAQGAPRKAEPAAQGHPVFSLAAMLDGR